MLHCRIDSSAQTGLVAQAGHGPFVEGVAHVEEPERELASIDADCKTLLVVGVLDKYSGIVRSRPVDGPIAEHEG